MVAATRGKDYYWNTKGLQGKGFLFYEEQKDRISRRSQKQISK